MADRNELRRARIYLTKNRWKFTKGRWHTCPLPGVGKFSIISVKGNALDALHIQKKRERAWKLYYKVNGIGRK